MHSTALQYVDLIREDGTHSPGLVPVYGSNTATLSVHEQMAVLDAKEFQHIDYVFFRRFSDGRSSQIAAYVIDNSDAAHNNQTLADLHRQLWLHGTAPLLYVTWPTRIDVLTCARGPDFWVSNGRQYQPVIQIAVEIEGELQARKRFSALRLADGTFWENPQNSSLAKHDKAAHQCLIEAVVQADNDLEGHKNAVLRRLLLLMVLIKYLEDRRVFPDEAWFGRFHAGARSFLDVLRGGEPHNVARLLNFLEKRFNGDVFALPVNHQSGLTNASLQRFAGLVEARTLGDQRYLWDQYSFKHLPVEIISHLYQRFVKGGHGTVYTPPLLTSLLLDKAMPYEELRGQERILDPGCGSGIFLVGAFRRLVSVWRSKNQWQCPSVEILKQILRQSIFGVDLDSDAVDLAAFSLALAVCDALKPKVIWKDLRLDPLRGRNILEGDFFETILAAQEESPSILDGGFDIIIGNPPFESQITPAGGRVDASHVQERGRLPDKQTAYLFLEQAFSHAVPNGKVCLIQPAGLIYNRKASSFRRHLFANNRVDAVLDFTSIRNLYDAADPKTIAVLGRNKPSYVNQIVKHGVFRRTFSVHEKICFELDHYDHHSVPQHIAVSEPFVWRANLLGGGRLLELSQRFRHMRTLADHVQEQEWDIGEGFIAATSGRREPAPFLTGQPFLPTDAFTESGIDEARIDVVTETRFRSAYTENRYMPPLVLIKASSSLPVVFWNKHFLGYRDKIVGISARPSEAEALRQFYETIRQCQSTYRFCCALNGSQAMVGRATAILKQDIAELPFPSDEKELELAFWEEVLRDDVLEFMIDYVRLGQNSELLRRPANAEEITTYAEMFVRMLGSVYKNLRPHEPLFLDSLICHPFYFGDRPKIEWLTDHAEELHRLVYHQHHEHLRTIRVLRFYQENVLFIVKPDRLRYWIRSTAIRDADETLVDLQLQGY